MHHPMTPRYTKVQGPTSAPQNYSKSAKKSSSTSASAQQKDPTSAQAHNNIVLQILDEKHKF